MQETVLLDCMDNMVTQNLHYHILIQILMYMTAYAKHEKLVFLKTT